MTPLLGSVCASAGGLSVRPCAPPLASAGEVPAQVARETVESASRASTAATSTAATAPMAQGRAAQDDAGCRAGPQCEDEEAVSNGGGESSEPFSLSASGGRLAWLVVVVEDSVGEGSRSCEGSSDTGSSFRVLIT